MRRSVGVVGRVTAVLIVAICLASIQIAVGSASGADSSSADSSSARKTPGCVTKKELRRIRPGMSERHVMRIFGVRKRQFIIYQGGGGLLVGYRNCHNHRFDPCARVDYDLSPDYVATVYAKKKRIAHWCVS